ncbi:hypothetical protein QQX98_009801 [Neonectria punicea]|uniref:Rhodopsin domain-containing protein n=1 Tax=Neonectria punicea TaxID=979145 RepID=A0ABR1GRC7_9HYPO
MAVDPAILAIFGPAPDGLDLKEQLVTAYNIVVCVTLGIATAFVALRFWVRQFKGSKLWYDDWAIVFAIICTSSTVATTILAGSHGAGEHVWSTNISRFITLIKLVYAEPYVYALAVTSTKVSILLLYHRLFRAKVDSNRIFSIMYWSAVSLTTVYPLILWITMACACRPVSYYWTQYLGAEGSCIDTHLFFLLLGIVNMLNDIVILLVPIPRILQLHLKKRVKASICGIMLLGSFVCVASIVRIYYLNGLFKNIDAAWWMGPSFAWSSIEPSVAIISACLPTLAPLFRMGRNKSTSNPYYVSDRTGQSGTGNHHSRNVAGRFNAGHSRIEDDEVELTYKVQGGDSSSSRGPDSQGSSEYDRNITVKTQVSVITQGRGDPSRRKQAR